MNGGKIINLKRISREITIIKYFLGKTKNISYKRKIITLPLWLAAKVVTQNKNL